MREQDGAVQHAQHGEKYLAESVAQYVQTWAQGTCDTVPPFGQLRARQGGQLDNRHFIFSDIR